MATRESAARNLIDPELVAKVKFPSFGDGPPMGPPPSSTEPIISNARLGLSMFLAAETMFFAGLIGAFLVFRLGSAIWPPPFQPRLPVLVTGINTAFLLMSGITMYMAVRAIRRDHLREVGRYLWATALFGTLFLTIQGIEWTRLVHFGLNLSTSIYGATFYTLIGCHALHVLGAVIWLIVVSVKTQRGSYTARNPVGLELCGMYWTFVVALWPVLYGLVYLY